MMLLPSCVCSSLQFCVVTKMSSRGPLPTFQSMLPQASKFLLSYFFGNPEDHSEIETEDHLQQCLSYRTISCAWERKYLDCL